MSDTTAIEFSKFKVYNLNPKEKKLADIVWDNLKEEFPYMSYPIDSKEIYGLEFVRFANKRIEKEEEYVEDNVILYAFDHKNKCVFGVTNLLSGDYIKSICKANEAIVEAKYELINPWSQEIYTVKEGSNKRHEYCIEDSKLEENFINWIKEKKFIVWIKKNKEKKLHKLLYQIFR